MGTPLTDRWIINDADDMIACWKALKIRGYRGHVRNSSGPDGSFVDNSYCDLEVTDHRSEPPKTITASFGDVVLVQPYTDTLERVTQTLYFERGGV